MKRKKKLEREGLKSKKEDKKQDHQELERKKKKKTAENLHSKLPNIIPVSKCRLRLLR